MNKKRIVILLMVVMLLFTNVTINNVQAAKYKTYKNKKYGISVKYPAKFRVFDKTKDWIHIKKGQRDYYVYPSFEPRKTKLYTGKKMYKDLKKRKYSNEYKKIKVGKRSIYYEYVEEIYHITYCIVSKKYGVQVTYSFGYGTKQQRKKYRKEAQQLIKTIKFYKPKKK